MDPRAQEQPGAPGATDSTPETTCTMLDIIFSCHLCNETFNKIYAGHEGETVQGLSDGINPSDRAVTRVFLTDCHHVICIEHLENGAPPFHKAGRHPEVDCPVCFHKATLFGMRGFESGQYDKEIPALYFIFPPPALEEKEAHGVALVAIKFQYISLARYAEDVNKELSKTLQELGQTQQEVVDAQEQVAQAKQQVARNQQEAAKTQQRIAQILADTQQNLAMTEDNSRDLELQNRHVHVLANQLSHLQNVQRRLPEISRYLSLIPKLIEQNKYMSERLNRLGFGALLEDLSNYDRPEQLQGLANDIKSSANGINNSLMHTLSDRTHPSIGSAATLVDTQPHLSPEGRPKKRMRVFSSLGLRPEQERNLDSRDQMPPPSKPFSRFGSMKKAFNSFRKKDFEGRATSALSFNTGEVVQDAQIHDQGTGNQLGSGYDRPFTRQGIQRSETPRMSGALPTGSVKKSPNRYSVGSITSSKGQFTFRSPIEFTRSSPNNLPNKPSYMHIMDGLGQSNGMDLGLKDPRQNNARPNHPGHQMSGHQMNGHQMSGHQMNGHQMNGHQMNGHQMNGAHQSSIPRENGNFGHPFLHQSPKDPKEIARGHPQPLRSNPVTQADIEMLNQVSTNPVTPTPRRLQKAAAPEDEDSVETSFGRMSVSETSTVEATPNKVRFQLD